MMRRTKATAIPMRVKRRVLDRDGGLCILCHRPGNPDAHFISRAQNGRGVEENIVTLCPACHRAYDGEKRNEYRPKIEQYLRSKYEGWNEASVVYRKWNGPSAT